MQVEVTGCYRRIAVHGASAREDRHVLPVPVANGAIHTDLDGDIGAGLDLAGGIATALVGPKFASSRGEMSIASVAVNPAGAPTTCIKSCAVLLVLAPSLTVTLMMRSALKNGSAVLNTTCCNAA